MNEKVEVKIKNLDEFNRLLENQKNAVEAVNGFELTFEVTRAAEISNVENAIKALEGLTPNEWLKIHSAVNEHLRRKRWELDRTIKLSSEELSEIINSGFL
ncbi:hypothetical protein [Holdemania massiliensis]|uniref:hypothetical protein n=1 Tax=Holdemania massiliensis TaxID=1468449 RepID=UPI001F061BB3|nr:hypothetical protein [Holdemania massiliensis]MCH1940501.1 hypothetical protein [Holdemania massiliensis]